MGGGGGGGEGGGGILFSSISCYFLGYDHPPPPNTHTHTKTQTKKCLSKRLFCFGLCQLVENTIERLEMM